jgi:TolB-like protein/Tfp pilus assembly protein PilF
MVHGQLGNRDAAAEAMRELLAVYPGFPDHAREEIEKFFFAQPDHAEHVLDGLRKAGLALPEDLEAGAPAATRTAASTPGSGQARADEGFWVAVLPFTASGSSPALAALADGLSESIVTGLSRFSYLRVIARSSTMRYAGEAVDVRAVGQQLGARYVMEGSLRQAGSMLRTTVQLVDAETGAHLWADTYTRPFDPAEVFGLQDDLVPRIVSTVADWYGVLPHSMSEAVRSTPLDRLSPYEALLRAFGYFERVTPAEHAVARLILERAVAEAPANGAAWAMLSMLYGEEHRFDFSAGPDPLGRALQAARRAVEASPSSHMSHLALAQAHYFRKEFAAFRSAAERAVTQNPLDGATVEYLAHLLAFSGDWARGRELGDRARQLNPNHPAWYWALPLLDAYRQGDYLGALALAPKSVMPGQYFSQALFAAVHGQLGDREAAREAVRQVLALRPDFATIVRDQFGRWYLPELVEQLIDGLRKAGLTIRR